MKSPKLFITLMKSINNSDYYFININAKLQKQSRLFYHTNQTNERKRLNKRTKNQRRKRKEINIVRFLKFV